MNELRVSVWGCLQQPLTLCIRVSVCVSGPMGVGKGHVLSWLSTQGLFPLEFIAHIGTTSSVPPSPRRMPCSENGYSMWKHVTEMCLLMYCGVNHI
jgi:hypothetical protein